MYTDRNNPLIVQGDATILLEVLNPAFEEARDSLLRFANLEKSPEYIHTYRLTPVSLWNAASSGMTGSDITGELKRFAKYEIPQNIFAQINEWLARYGRLKLLRTGSRLMLKAEDPDLFSEITRNKHLKKYIYSVVSDTGALLLEWSRGQVKKECIDLGYPVVDMAGYSHGDPCGFEVKGSLSFREYQRDSVSVFMNYEKTGGSGVVVLPCGAGKTVVGMGVMEQVGETSLILVTNITAARQWKRELLDKTTLPEDHIGEYSGEIKETKPVTIATYQILTYRRRKGGDFIHLEALNRQNWGLVIYDEVHLLPAPVFRFATEVQSKRRLGLTATLIREDGREKDVFSLIGPKVFDMPWKVLEKQGWISGVTCTEIRTDLPRDEMKKYALEGNRERFKRASVNKNKTGIIEYLLSKHKGDNILIIGHYLKQLEYIAGRWGLTLITGRMKNTERDKFYDMFRRQELRILVVSKVANFAVDLPDANIAVQVSGTFGSRQEEAQRLGRILRPKVNKKAHFYSLVTRDTVEADFAEKRQLFLTEQGYSYEIISAEDLLEKNSPHGESGENI
jgi:DNA excision repair protein ERCC-3